MAYVAAPTINWASPTTMPQAQSRQMTNNMSDPTTNPPIMTQLVIPAPHIDQLINFGGVGYSQ